MTSSELTNALSTANMFWLASVICLAAWVIVIHRRITYILLAREQHEAKLDFIRDWWKGYEEYLESLEEEPEPEIVDTKP